MMNQNRFFSSSIGSKILMSVTGLFVIFFLIAHLAGNLEIFSGKESVNAYGVFLRSMPKFLWGMRIALILSFVLHIWTSIRLSIQNRRARPIPYAQKYSVQATLASRTMLLGGLVVLAFLLFHLAQLTFGWINPEYANLIDDKGRHDVYNMTVLGFQNIYVVLLYMIAQIFLGMHISHGFSSSAQTLGLTSNGKWAFFLRRGGILFAILMAALYISIPASVWLGIIQTEL